MIRYRTSKWLSILVAVLVTTPALGQTPSLQSVAGRRVTGSKVANVANVRPFQAEPSGVQSGSFLYLRLGQGSNLGGGKGGPVIGYGVRTELDSFGIDVSFLNTHDNKGGPNTMSLAKLQGMYFKNARAYSTIYAGGGIGYSTSGLGSTGLQGELTFGYEFARATPVRIFFQADVSLPFYKTTFENYSGSTSHTIGTDRRYAPLVSISVGLGRKRR
jgi:hypothetical protein